MYPSRSSHHHNTIYTGDCITGLRHRIPDASVGLVFTSPPYNIGLDYGVGSDARPLDQYLAFLDEVFRECIRVLVPGGHLVINHAICGRGHCRPYPALLTAQLHERIPFRGEVVWDKQHIPAFNVMGSWRSPSAPCIRTRHESLLVFRKDGKRRGTSTIDRDTFLAGTESIWKIAPEMRRAHPAPFPEALARRVVTLFSFREEIVLDPFMGSGTTAVAAVQLGRPYVGFELNPDFVRMARTRIARVLTAIPPASRTGA